VQHTATHCNTLQHTATHCSSLTCPPQHQTCVYKLRIHAACTCIHMFLYLHLHVCIYKNKSTYVSIKTHPTRRRNFANSNGGGGCDHARYVAVCCTMLQCVAVWCKFVAVCRSVRVEMGVPKCSAVLCCSLLCIAVFRCVLQYTAVY